MNQFLEFIYTILFWAKCLGASWVVYAITYNYVTWLNNKGKTVGRWDQASIERTPVEHPNVNIAKTKTKSHINKDYWLADSVQDSEKPGKPWAITVFYGITKIVFFPEFIKKIKD